MIFKNKTLKYKLLKTSIFFCCIQIVFFLFNYLSDKPIFGLLSFESLLTSDGSFNDLYYQQNSIKLNPNKKLSGRLIIINTGSFEKDSFRLDLSKTIKQIQKYKPRVIGIDHTFSNVKKIGTDSLIDVIDKSENIILSSNKTEKNPLKLNKKKSQYGITTFEKEQISIRKYSSDSNTFGYKIAAKLLENKMVPFEHKSFFINYITDSKDIFSIKNQLDTILYKVNSRNKFLIIEGEELLCRKELLNNFLSKTGKNNAFLIGHFGNNKIYDVINDREDRHRVPCDKNLVERKESMFGVQIHANAIENYLNPEIRFNCWTDTIVFLIIKNILIFLFIYYILFINFGNVFNILTLVILTFPLIYIVLFLMTKHIYIEIGLTMLQFLILEEVVEAIDSIHNYITKLKKKWKKEI